MYYRLLVDEIKNDIKYAMQASGDSERAMQASGACERVARFHEILKHNEFVVTHGDSG